MHEVSDLMNCAQYDTQQTVRVQEELLWVELF